MELKKVLQNKEFHVRYQPQIDIASGKISGAEALVRIKKNDGVMISPGIFIPSLEKEGKIIELDEEVLKMVCEDIREAKHKGIDIPPISVNISRLNMGFPDSADRLKHIAESFSVENRLLVFELTESGVYMDEKDDLVRLMGKLQKMGFQISLDDYGTGFSSLKLLADVHFDILKLDRYFVSQIGDIRIDTILRHVIKLAESLGITAIAEGVENISQLDFLRENGCKFVQGYYYFRPLSKSELFKRLSGGEKGFEL